MNRERIEKAVHKLFQPTNLTPTEADLHMYLSAAELFSDGWLRVVEANAKGEAPASYNLADSLFSAGVFDKKFEPVAGGKIVHTFFRLNTRFK